MKTIIELDHFLAVDMRVGQVIDVVEPTWSSKLLKLTVDFGDQIGTRTIFAGLKKWYQPEVFLNQKFAFVLNLAEKKMGEEYSQGMMLVVGGKKPSIIPMPADVELGAELC